MTANHVILKSAIVGAKVNHTVKDGTVTTQFSLVCPMSLDIAVGLGCDKLLYTSKGRLNDQYKTIKLKSVSEMLRILIEPQGIPKSLSSVVDSWEPSVSCDQDGLRLNSQFSMVGDPYAVVEFLLKVGNAECQCKIEKMQPTLAEVAGKDAPAETEGESAETESGPGETEAAPDETEGEAEAPDVLVHISRIRD